MNTNTCLDYSPADYYCIIINYTNDDWRRKVEIDYEALKIISKDSLNKCKNAFDDSVALSSLLKLLSNIIYTTSNFTLNEIVLFINSMSNWLGRKSQKSTTKYKTGEIIEFDCGLNFRGELSYRHTGLVLDESNDMVLTIPATSGENYIKKTCEKDNGRWYYKLVGKNEGFNHDCVLILNNIKMVSKRRIIASYGNICTKDSGQTFLDDIKTEIIFHYFSKQYSEFENQILDLNSELEQKNKELQILQERNKYLEDKTKEQKEKINKFYASIRRKKK